MWHRDMRSLSAGRLGAYSEMGRKDEKKKMDVSYDSEMKYEDRMVEFYVQEESRPYFLCGDVEARPMLGPRKSDA